MSEDEKNIDDIKNSNKKTFNFPEVITVIFVTLAIGIVIGYVVSINFSDNKNKNSKELNEFISAYNNIRENYYEEVSDEDLIKGAINGLLSATGDPYTSFLDEDATSDFNDRMNGSYSGLGVEIATDKDKNIIIATVFEDSPAEKAGLKIGDIFKKIGDEDISKLSSSEIADKIKNSKEKNITITVLRGEEEITVSAQLSIVELKSVTYKTINYYDKLIGYIDIDLFALNTYSQFKSAVESLEKEGIDSLIIDVRSNTGGYLDSVTNMISMFLKKGEIVYQLEEKGKKTKVLDETKESRSYNIVVLANEYSASASEILASSLQESYGAKVIGTNTYGKGTVQQTKDLKTTDAMYKFTIQKWLTPKGNWINEKGVTPDVEVKLDEKYLETRDDNDDNQLQKGLEEIVK